MSKWLSLAFVLSFLLSLGLASYAAEDRRIGDAVFWGGMTLLAMLAWVGAGMTGVRP